MINNLDESREIIKDLIKNFKKEELFNFKKEKFFYDSEKTNKIIAIDGGNNFFKNPILQQLGVSYISIIAFSDNLIEKKEFILFEKCSLDLKKKQLEKIKELEIFGDSDDLLKIMNEKDYKNEEREEEESFSKKVRDLLELSFLIKYSKENLVVRDGLFYFPKLNGLKENFLKNVNLENIFALAKKSKLLRDFGLNSFLYKLENTREKEEIFLININNKKLEEYYETKNFLINSKHFLISFSPYSYYHLEVPLIGNEKIILSSLVHEVKNGKKGYPKCLIMADKLVKATDNLVKKYENLLLKMVLEEMDKDLKEIFYRIEKKFQIRK